MNSWRLQQFGPTATLVEVSEQMTGLLPFIFPKQFNQKLSAGLESWLSGLKQSFAKDIEPK